MNDKPTRWDYVTAAIITILCACWTVFEYYINPDKIPFEPIIALVAGLFAIWGYSFRKGKETDNAPITTQNSNEIRANGTNNIIIQSVTDSTITLTVNGDVQEIRKEIAELRELLEKQHTQTFQVGEKVYNIGSIDEAKFSTILNNVKYAVLDSPITAARDVNFAEHLHIGDNYYGSNTTESINTTLHVWIISTTKDNYSLNPTDKFFKDIPRKHYHKSDPAEWIPFKNNDSIKTFIEEYKQAVNFKVAVRFLGNEPIQKNEMAWVLNNLDRIVLVFDPLALQGENLTTISRFNTLKIGGCLGLVCYCISYNLFSYFRSRVEQCLDFAIEGFLDFKNLYIHFIFPISTKEMLFRSLTNIALVHLKVSVHIEGFDSKSVQTIRNNDFNISI